jgi:hypothetical protein
VRTLSNRSTVSTSAIDSAGSSSHRASATDKVALYNNACSKRVNNSVVRVITSENDRLSKPYMYNAFLSTFKVLAVPVLARLFAVIRRSKQKVNLGTRWRKGLQQQGESDDNRSTALRWSGSTVNQRKCSAQRGSNINWFRIFRTNAQVALSLKQLNKPNFHCRCCWHRSLSGASSSKGSITL